MDHVMDHVILPMQEPGSDIEIKAFANKYGVEFDMFSKVDVNGSSAIPLYKFLKSRVRGSLGSFIKWNFEKVCLLSSPPPQIFRHLNTHSLSPSVYL